MQKNFFSYLKIYYVEPLSFNPVVDIRTNLNNTIESLILAQDERWRRA